MENDSPLINDNQNPRLSARHLFWQGWRVVQIAEQLNIEPATVYSWKRRDDWDNATPLDRIEGTLEARLMQLIVKNNKDGKDFKEIDLLTRQIERMARVNKYNTTGKESDLNPEIKKRNEAPKSKPKLNEIGEENTRILVDAFHNSLFDYQKIWLEASSVHRIRNLLKSRQIGATWYFAREAFIDALKTGKNKIFLSASKAQAHVFKSYIIQFCLEHTGVELRGDPLRLPNGATLYFLGTNARTAQSYHGDMYMDEYFWINKFLEFRSVASGMAMHKQWRQTYFSTPSSITHEAYQFWSGDLFNKRRKKENRIDIDLSHGALKSGFLCADGQWRQIVTVEDALRGGCDLFDLDQLRLEYSDDEFDNLLMCQFLDDTLAVFPLAKMQRCCVDSWLVWRDLKPLAIRPFGNSEVWLGYDPDGGGENGDGAGVVLIAPGKNRQSAHRIIYAHRLHNKDYEAQAEFILNLCRDYNVTYIGMDTTGLGDAVAQIVEKLRFVTRFQYSPDIKQKMVLQAQHIIDKGRLHFDAGRSDIAQSFMAIRRTLTPSGTQITYKARRTNATGHSELAWATMHALHNEPITGPVSDDQRSLIEIFS